MRRAMIALVLSAASPCAATAQIATGTDAGVPGHVKVFDAATLANTASFFAYSPGFTGGVRVALGDVSGDGVADVITGAGTGGLGHVKVFDGVSGAELRSFFAFPGFTGGVFVAAGDIDGDGRADIVAGMDAGAPGQVTVFSGATGAVIRSFIPYAGGLAGGVRVATGDVNGDGRADIITGAGPGAPGGHVKAFDGITGLEIRSFLAYGGFAGGVYVATGDVNGDLADDIITGAGAGAPGGHVKVFDGRTGAEIRSFLAFEPAFTGGVRVGALHAGNDPFADIIAGAGPGAGAPQVTIFDGASLARLRSFAAYPGYAGGVFVAGSDVAAAAVPEPGTAGLLALGVAGLVAARTRHRRRDA